MTLIYLTLAWLLGIALAGWLQPPLVILLALAGLAFSYLLLWWREPGARIRGACALLLLAGALRFYFGQPRLGADHIASHNDRGPVTLIGVVDADPDIRDRYTQLRVRVRALLKEDGERKAHGRILVWTGRYPYHRYGEELRISGHLLTPPLLDGFSYKEYLARQGIYSMMRYPEIVSLGQAGNPFYTLLFALRRRAQGVIASFLPEPESSLLTGILLGIESAISQETLDAFIATGTIHIIVISGFNMTLLAGTLLRLGTRLANRMRALIPAMLVLVGYALLVGGGAPVVRATIMVSASLLAYLVGRPYAVENALAASVAIMTFFAPRLLWDVSFQLSAMSTLGLVVLAPRATKWLGARLERWLADRKAALLAGILDDLLIASLAAQLTTIPIIAHHFQRISLISPLTNLLILPIQPYIMILGGFATLVGLFFWPVARVLAWAPWLFLAYTTRVVEWTAQPDWASVPLRIAPWMAALCYALPFVVSLVVAGRKQIGEWWPQFWVGAKRHVPTKLALSVLATTCLLVWIAVARLPDGRLHVHFLDVGQGDAILIVLPQGQQVLIDGGPEPSRLLAALGRRMPFWDRSLDLVLLTHADMDHLGGLLPVLERYQIEAVADNGFSPRNPPTEYWHQLATARGLTPIQARRDMRFIWGDQVQMDVLHPGPVPLTDTDAAENDHSLVLRLIYGEMAFLFTGDIEAAAEADLISAGQLAPSQVLKVSHHGAAEGSNVRFLQAVRPQLAIISVGSENRHGHPAPATLRRLEESGAQVLRTDQQGSIEVVTDGFQLWVRTSR